MHIVITRPKEDSTQLIKVLESQGHFVTHVPVIKIEKLKTEKINLENYKAVIFTSSNAIKFTPDGYVALDVVVNDNQLTFTITDTGIGMDPQQTKQVFESFLSCFSFEIYPHVRRQAKTRSYISI